MNTTLLAVKDRLKEFNKWLNSVPEKNVLMQLMVLFAVVFLLIIPLGTATTLIAIYLSWLSGFIVSVCILLFVVFIIIGVTSKSWRRWAFRMARNCLVGPACLWASAIIFGIVCGVFTHTASRIVSSKLQLPLGEPQAVAVDSEGRIYCASSFYKRLQVYDDQGNFLRGWFVPYLAKYSLLLKMDSANRIHVATKVGQRRESMIFDSQGNLVETTRNSGIFADGDKESNLEVCDSKGNIYSIQSSVLFPRVVKIDPSGKELALISDTLNLWLIKAGFPAFAFLMGSILLLFVLSKFEQKHKTTPNDLEKQVVPTKNSIRQ